jgi:hypothetical protein
MGSKSHFDLTVCERFQAAHQCKRAGEQDAEAPVRTSSDGAFGASGDIRRSSLGAPVNGKTRAVEWPSVNPVNGGWELESFAPATHAFHNGGMCHESENACTVPAGDPTLGFLEDPCSDVRFISRPKDPFLLLAHIEQNQDRFGLTMLTRGYDRA